MLSSHEMRNKCIIIKLSTTVAFSRPKKFQCFMQRISLHVVNELRNVENPHRIETPFLYEFYRLDLENNDKILATKWIAAPALSEIIKITIIPCERWTKTV